MNLLSKTVSSKNVLLKTFLYSLGLATLIFFPFQLVDSSHFLFYGDFNVQQIPFYHMCHDAIRSGSWQWNWTTNLNANFIGSYSFYLLDSPSFWLIVPFPSNAVPYLTGPLLVLKLTFSGCTGCLYLKRYVRDPGFAMVDGMLYAFSGFSVCNVFFNHFHEVIIVFPLLLWTMDEYMYHCRRSVFTVTVFASCFISYYFFVGQAVFCTLYWLVRAFCGDWEIAVRDLLPLLVESVLGVALSGALLVPTILTVAQNPRVDDPPDGWGTLLYGRNRYYMRILQSFFSPPDIPTRPNLTPNSEAKWASLGAWLPLFSMVGVFAFLQNHHRHWLRKLLSILFLMAMVPILNSAFQLFNTSHYAQWFYMLVLVICLAILISLERENNDWRRAVYWVLGITLGIALPIGLMPWSKTNNGTATHTVGLEEYPIRFWAYMTLALFGLPTLCIVMKYWRRDKKIFWRRVLAGVTTISFLYSIYFISLGKTQSKDVRRRPIPYTLDGDADVSLPDLQNVCPDFYHAMDNQVMYWQVPSIQTFHSIVPGSIAEFYPTIDVTRDVGSRLNTKTYGLHALTSCHWLLDYTGDNNYFGDENRQNLEMPGRHYYGTQNGFDVWGNEYYVPMGFSCDSYVTQEQYDEASEGDRDLPLLHALVLSDKQIQTCGFLLTQLDTADLGSIHDEYYEACQEQRASTGTEFSHDSTGFSLHCSAEKERLVFFSVPYESGWNATVNGQTVPVEKVSVGFVAVEVPAGESDIRSEYRTLGLDEGLAMSGAALVLLMLYHRLTLRMDNRLQKDRKRRIFRVRSSENGAAEEKS